MCFPALSVKVTDSPSGEGSACQSELREAGPAVLRLSIRIGPLSLVKRESNWETGLNVLEAKNFLDIWHHPKTVEWRNQLTSSFTDKHGCRHCPTFKELSL